MKDNTYGEYMLCIFFKPEIIFHLNIDFITQH